MCMINGELGLKDISEYIENRMMNFWYNIATGIENKVSSVLYKWIKVLHDQNKYKSAWIEKVKTTLDITEMPNLFHDTTSVNKSCFKNNIKVRLEDVYAKRWSDSVFNNGACLNYRLITVVKNDTKLCIKTT